jgi:ADP-ribose pyrophosphatase
MAFMKIEKWKTLKSEYMYRETWFTVRKDTCETVEGKIISPYYVYEFPTWVTILPITEEGKVIMVKQYRHAIGEIILEIPGGCVDDTDNNLEEAAGRELIEETGYNYSSIKYVGRISPNPSTNTNWMHMFLARGCKLVQELKLDHNEEIEVELISLRELKELVKENKIIQSMHVNTIMYGLMAMGESL